MNRSALWNSLPIVVRALAEKVGVEVRIGGTAAYSTPELIQIPALPENIDQEGFNAILGYAAHEAAGHHRHTDFYVGQDLDPFRSALLNAVEDIRVEGLAPTVFPGTKSWLSSVSRQVALEGTFNIKSDSSPADVLIFTVLSWGRSRVLLQGAELDTVHAANQLVFENIFGKELWLQLEALLPEMANLESTQAALDLVNRIRSLLTDATDQEAGQNQEQGNDPGNSQGQNQAQGQGDDQGNSQGLNQAQGQGDDQGNGQGQNQAQGQGDDQGNGQGQNQAQGQGDDQGNSQGLNQAQGQGGSSGDGQLSKVWTNAKSAMNADKQDITFQDLGGMLENKVNQACVQDDQSTTGSLGISTVKSSDAPFDIMKHRQSVNVLRSRLRSLLLSSARTKRTHYEEGSDLNISLLPEAMMGNRRLFEMEEQKVQVETAVTVLLDSSISMRNEGRMQCALHSTLALCDALSGMKGVKSSAYHFPYCESGTNNIGKLKDFDEHVSLAFGRFASVKPSGLTPLGPAMMTALSTLLFRKENRAILIVVTDGEPDSQAEVTSALRLAKKAGVEVVCLGVNTSSGADIFPVFAKVDDPQQLVTAMMATLQSKFRLAA